MQQKPKTMTERTSNEVRKAIKAAGAHKEMTLPYDYARCEGVQHDDVWREGCEDCQRRTSPGRPEGWQPWIKPPEIIVFECEYRIPEDES